MRYLLLLYSDPAVSPQRGTPEFEAEHKEWVDYTQELQEAGVMLGGDALHPVSTATTVQLRQGKVLSVDGPFAETKEVLGGYYMIDVADLDAATEWAGKVPLADYGSVEIRPVVEQETWGEEQREGLRR